MDIETQSLRLVVEKADRLHIELNRPDVRNAISRSMVAELHEVCADLEDRPRILILSGAGGVFSAGADILELSSRTSKDALDGVNSRLSTRINSLPMPVIAAVQGWALGGGAELAYAADLRLAAPDARFGNPEVGLGIIAGAGATWRLKELVGETLALEMLFTGKNLAANEAVEAGLVNGVHDDVIAAAYELADRIAAQDPLAVRYTKRVFHAPP